MPLKLLTNSTVPPGGFRFTEKATGEKLTAPTWPDLIDVVRRHRQANGITTNGDLEAEIEDQLCQVLPAGFCKRESGGAYDPHIAHSIGVSQMIEGTKTLLAWYLSGSQRVTQDVANNRARVCSGCHFNQLPSGCTSCNQNAVHEVVNKITGGEKPEGASHLEGCLICGCSLKAKVWLPLETIQKHTSDETNGKFPEWCWAKRK